MCKSRRNKAWDILCLVHWLHWDVPPMLAPSLWTCNRRCPFMLTWRQHVSQGTHTHTIPHCLAQHRNIFALISLKLFMQPPDSLYGGDKGINCLAWEEVKAGNSCQLCWTRPGGGHADWHVESPASKLATKARALCGPWVWKCKLGHFFPSLAIHWSLLSLNTGRGTNCTHETRSCQAKHTCKASIARANGISDAAVPCFWLPRLLFPTYDNKREARRICCCSSIFYQAPIYNYIGLSTAGKVVSWCEACKRSTVVQHRWTRTCRKEGKTCEFRD